MMPMGCVYNCPNLLHAWSRSKFRIDLVATWSRQGFTGYGTSQASERTGFRDQENPTEGQNPTI